MAHTDYVVLVDKNDRVIGKEEKLVAHREKKLHRAFSIFVFFDNGQSPHEVLIQQRNLLKYHSGGLWTNSCCGHPSPDQEIDKAAQQRLREETGIDIALKKIGVFHYEAKLNNDMYENEIDHVFVGVTNSKDAKINPDEIMDHAWRDLTTLQQDLQCNPEKYTVWFEKALNLVVNSKAL